MPRLAVLLAALALLAPAGAGEELGDWLARLGSGSAHERERAQRWLGVHLEPSDYPRLAEAARDADPEMGRRLALSLGSEPRHLPLAVLLLDERDAGLRTIGSEAFEDLVTRWCPQAAERSARRADLARVLTPLLDRDLRVRRRRERLELTLDRLDRLGPLPVPVVLDPSLGGRTIEAVSDVGDPLRVLAALALRNGLALVGVGDWEGEEPGRGAWILVTEQSGALARSGAAHLLSWCLAVERDTPAAESAARALATTGWPAAVGWLERRWLERRDPAALEGLLVAAARGRVASGLRRIEERAELLRRADAALVEPLDPLDGLDDGSQGLDSSPARRQAERLGRALIGAGSLASGGLDDSAALLEGWDELSSAQRWWRLWILEGRGAGSPRVRDFLVEEVRRSGAVEPALRLQSLRALAASPRRSLETVSVADLEALAGWALSEGYGAELVVLLDSLGVGIAAGALGASEGVRRLELHAHLRGRREELASSTLRDLARGASSAGLEALGEELSARRRDCGPGLVERVVRSTLDALDEPDRGRLARTAALAGALDVRGRRELFVALNGELVGEQLDWELLGALAGAPGGQAPLERLQGAVVAPPTSAASRRALAAGLELARRRLHEAGEDAASELLVETVHRAAEDPGWPLRGRLSAGRWPPAQEGVQLDLARLEREIPASLR